jgi:phosphodiesterase/alkaline phosphatase D-like protein
MRRIVAIAVLTVVLTAGAAVALAATSPSVTTGSASSVHDTYATLNGTVNPNGTATTYYFQWDTTTAYGATSSTHSAGRGSANVAVRATASHLTPGTTYHYRLIASSGAGTSTGADRTFTTTGYPPPDVATGPAGAISTNSAVVTGAINPRGDRTSWTVQYGTSTSYGVETFSGSLPPGNSPVSVSATLRGLAAGTIFHYRFVARHSSTIVSYGADQQFMTYTSPRPVPGIRAHTTPGRKRHRPFAFTTTGRVLGPSWIPATYGCAGQVRIRWFLGRRAIKATVVPLQPNCTFTAQTVFRRRWKHPLSGFVRYLGTGYLAPALARHPQHVVLG